MQTRSDRCAPCYGRRAVLGPFLGLALAPLLAGLARAEDEPEKTDAARLPPQPGDRFVFLTGPNKGQVVKLDNLAVGGPQVQVFPAGPDGAVRNGTPLNLVILARFDPADLSEETRARAAEGVVAYSAVCTHQACPVNMWSKDRDAFVCSCHGSVFDPRNGAVVVDGPAPRPLPSLALKVADGAVAIVSGFSSRVGGTQK
jgi:rieske iron-sulfur protein